MKIVLGRRKINKAIGTYTTFITPIISKIKKRSMVSLFIFNFLSIKEILSKIASERKEKENNTQSAFEEPACARHIGINAITVKRYFATGMIFIAYHTQMI